MRRSRNSSPRTSSSMNKGLLSVDEALGQLLAGAAPVSAVEEVPALEASGRILARAQRSTMDVPPMDNSAMDGYAVRSSDLERNGKLRVSQKIMAGSVGKPLEPGTAARIFTGAPIPSGADAVVIQEETEAVDDSVVVKKKPGPGDWVRYVGSDIRKNSEILPAGKRLLPQDTGLAASVGIKTLPVYRKLRLGLFLPATSSPCRGSRSRRGASTTRTVSRCAAWSRCSAASCATTASCPIPSRRRARRCAAPRRSAI